MGSVIVYNSQGQQLLTVRYQTDCLSYDLFKCEKKFTAEHHSLGEVLRTQKVKQDRCCFICPCPVSTLSMLLYKTLVNVWRRHLRWTRTSWKFKVVNILLKVLQKFLGDTTDVAKTPEEILLMHLQISCVTSTWTGTIAKSKSYSGIFWNKSSIIFYSILFSQGENTLATLNSRVESFYADEKVLFIKTKVLKDQNYTATINFPQHLPIQIKLCNIWNHFFSRPDFD